MYSIPDPEVCLWTLTVFSFYRSVLCSSLLLIALERYITIMKPLTYCYILTDARIKASILASWGVASTYMIGAIIHRLVLDPPKEDMLYCQGSIYEMRRVHIAQGIVGVVICCIIPFIYCHLQIIARRHLIEIERERRLFGLAQFKRNVKRSNVALKITLSFILLEIPFFTVNFMRMYGTASEDQEHLLMKVSGVSFLLSLIAQPVMYVAMSPDFRKSFRSLLGRNRVLPLDDAYP